MISSNVNNIAAFYLSISIFIEDSFNSYNTSALLKKNLKISWFKYCNYKSSKPLSKKESLLGYISTALVRWNNALINSDFLWVK